MIKKIELQNWFDSLIACYDSDDRDKEAIAAIRSLILTHGGDEVGDEEGERLIEHFEENFGDYDYTCSQCQQIIALIRRGQKRTVSREQFHEWASFDWGNSYGGTVYNIKKILSELGLEVEEKA